MVWWLDAFTMQLCSLQASLPRGRSDAQNGEEADENGD